MVIVIPLPAANVRVSVDESATTLDWPDTAIVLNTSPPPPGIVIVLVAPVPVAVTPEPTKFKVVPAVDNDEPSSCTVTPLLPPGIVIVFVAPVPVAVTPAPTKFNVPNAVDKADPSSCTVIEEPPPEAAIVTVSVPGVVVIVMFEPATKVSVSLLESATTFDWPETAIVPKALPPADMELNDKLPDPSVTKAWPFEPSLVG